VNEAKIYIEGQQSKLIISFRQETDVPCRREPDVPYSFFFTYLLINHSVEKLHSAAYGSVFDTINSIRLPKEGIIKNFEDNIRNYFLKIYKIQPKSAPLKNCGIRYCPN
jgi:hypothetical protein